MALTLPGGIAMRCNKSVHIGSASVLLLGDSVTAGLNMDVIESHLAR
jgi:hypothetical protein